MEPAFHMFGLSDVVGTYELRRSLSSWTSEEDEPVLSTSATRARENLTELEEYCVYIIAPVTLWFIAVLVFAPGFYTTQIFVLGPNSSLLLEPSRLLVNEIQIQVIGDGQAGPILYGFPVVPILGSETTWKESHELIVAPNNHQELVLWLNKGSFLNVTCLIQWPSVSDVLVKVLEECKETRSWTQDPSQQSDLLCNQAHGEVGQLHYLVPRDGNYSIIAGNLNQQNVGILLDLEVHAKLYSTDTADYLCTLQNTTCQVQIFLFQNKFAVLSTPQIPQQGKSWEVKLSYEVRWLTFFVSLGCLFVVASAIFKIFRCKKFEDVDDVGRAPLLLPNEKMEQDFGTDPEDGLGADDENNNAQDPSGHEICAVCLDACKSSFFIPCGHSATCLTCGLKIKNGEAGICPFCREKIEVVKRMFDA